MDDPDAPGGTWVHWVIYHMPNTTQGLNPAIPPDPILPDGSRHGQNSWQQLGYGGPCPPSGIHHYSFRLYALDTIPELEADANKTQLIKAMEGRIVAQAELIGLYRKP